MQESEVHIELLEEEWETVTTGLVEKWPKPAEMRRSAVPEDGRE